MSGDDRDDGAEWAAEPLLTPEASHLERRELLVYFLLQIASLREHRVYDNTEAVTGL